MITSSKKRSIYVPVSYPSDDKVKVGLQNGNTRLTCVISWDPSNAYMLEENVGIRVLQGEGIMALLITLEAVDKIDKTEV